MNIDFLKFFRAEREEIMRHKWNLSFEAKRDVGFEAALLSWVKNHKEKWAEEYLNQEKAYYSAEFAPKDIT